MPGARAAAPSPMPPLGFVGLKSRPSSLDPDLLGSFAWRRNRVPVPMNQGVEKSLHLKPFSSIGETPETWKT
jgi:hypothetical protein